MLPILFFRVCARSHCVFCYHYDYHRFFSCDVNERLCVRVIVSVCEFGWIPFCIYYFPFECIYRLFACSLSVSAYNRTNEATSVVCVYNVRKFDREGVVHQYVCYT